MESTIKAEGKQRQHPKKPMDPVAPFCIVVDTREQLPWQFVGIRMNKTDGGELVTISTARDCLAAGDYSLGGYQDKIAIERKSKADLFSTIGQGRARFVRELERLNAMEAAWVVVECEWSSIFADPPKHCRLPPLTIHRSVNAWEMRYRNVHWRFMPGRRCAMMTTFRILERYWKIKQEEMKKGKVAHEKV